MANIALDTFVRDAINHGEDPESISATLISAGRSRKEVEAALDGWATADFGMAVREALHFG